MTAFDLWHSAALADLDRRLERTADARRRDAEPAAACAPAPRTAA